MIRREPYDDTGWTFGELFNVRVLRVADAKIARHAMGARDGSQSHRWDQRAALCLCD